MEDICILHLSDIHAGSGELIDEDNKIRVPNAERKKQLLRLSDYLRALPTVPDFVIVSGDITIRGQKDGLETFREWLFEHIESGHLPVASRIMIVPGNHDVTRRTRVDVPDSSRLKNFWEVFGTAFPHAHIPDHDPPFDPRRFAVDKTARGPLGGIKTTKRRGRVVLTTNLPFLLDLDAGVLIYAFNSAHGCGVPLQPNTPILEALTPAAESPDGGRERHRLIKAREAYLDSLIIDAGMITDEQISDFSQTMSRLRSKFGEKFQTLTKIAVLHHHISHLWKQQLELKQFEATVDASNLKQALIESSFDIVLHGHKHTNHVGIDGSLIPVSDKTQFNPICVVSAGTVGGFPRLNDRQTFKVLLVPKSNGLRTKVTIKEVPIRETANAAAVIANESKIYHAPLSKKLPLLHDIEHVKDALDDYVVAKKAPELSGAPGLRGSVSLEPHNSSLFSASLRYRCHSYLDANGHKTFYEVILATARLDFKVMARVHWLVSDALGDSESDVHRVVVLVGNLENTHYSEAITVGEIRDSIDAMRGHFQPAISARKLEIRSYLFRQEEVAKVAQNAEVLRENVG